MADWDADDFEPDTATPAVVSMPSDKWDGEDEEDDIKVRFSARKSPHSIENRFLRTPGMPSQMKKTLRSPRRRSR